MQARVKELYPDLQTLTIEDYEILKEKINSGDRSALTELIEKSLKSIFMSVVYIYSAYDFSKLDFEDALGIAYEHAYTLITANTKLTKTKRQYEGVININTKLYLSRMYQKMLRHNAHLAGDDYAEVPKQEFNQNEVDFNLSREDIMRVVTACYNEFSPVEQVVFNMSFKDRNKDITIAKAVGKTVPVVRYIRSQIKNKILKALKKSNFEVEEFENNLCY